MQRAIAVIARRRPNTCILLRDKIAQDLFVEINIHNVSIFLFFFPVCAIQIYKMCILSVQVQRLADYERYLGQEARSLIDNECIDSGTVLHRGQLEGDLHRIQELFPGDNLRLHERDVVTTVRYFFLSI